MDKKRKNILSYVFWGAVAVVLLYFCIRAIDWEMFRAALAVCKWEFVLLSMLLGVVVLLIRGARWQMLLSPIDPSISVRSAFNAYNICMAVNLALPRAGELVRLGYVVKHSAQDAEGRRLLSFDKALGTLLTERAWDTLVTLAMVGVLLVAKWEDYGSFLLKDISASFAGRGIWWLLGALAAAGLGFLALVFALRKKGGLWERLWGFVEGIWSGLVSFAHMRRGWLFLLYTAAIWCLYWLMSACIVWSLQDWEMFASFGPADAFFIMVVGCISSVIPVPGGFGAYHGMVSGALRSLWDIPVGAGMIFATLNHESQVVTQAVCGLVSYLRESFGSRRP